MTDLVKDLAKDVPRMLLAERGISRPHVGAGLVVTEEFLPGIHVAISRSMAHSFEDVTSKGYGMVEQTPAKGSAGMVRAESTRLSSRRVLASPQQRRSD